MKRPLAFFALCFSGTLALLAALNGKGAFVGALVSLALLAGCYCLYFYKARAALLCALFAVCAASFAAWTTYSLRYAQIERNSGRKLECSVVIEDIDKSSYFTRPLVTARLKSSGGKPCLNSRVEFFSGDALQAGDRLKVVLDFDEIMPGRQEESLTMSAELLLIKSREGRNRFLSLSEGLRRYMDSAIEATLGDSEEAALASAVITGRRSALSAQTREAMSRAGDSHILAVSGLHISLALGTLLALLKRLRLPSALFAASALVLSLFFIFFYGATASVTRAALMALLGFSSGAFMRKSDPVTSMSFAALVILITSPLAITSASFVLSFACCFAIVAVFPRIEKSINERADSRGGALLLFSPLIKSFLLSLIISLVTLPALIALGFPISVIAPVVNLFVLLLIPFLLAGSFLTPLFLAVPYSEPLRMLAALVSGVSAKLILHISKLAAALPYASQPSGAPWLKLWATFSTAAFALAFVFRKRLKPRYFLIGALSLAMLVSCATLRRLFTADKPRIISYGDSVIIDSGGDAAVVVDYISYNGTVYLESYLKQRGISDIETIIIRGFLSEEKLEALKSATGCYNVVEAEEDESRSFAAGVFVSFSDEGEIIIDSEDGLRFKFYEPALESHEGYRIIAYGEDGSRLLSNGEAEYHSADLTIYLLGGGKYKAVAE